DDLRLLAEHFLRELNEKSGSSRRFSDDAYAILQNHAWPGNVRELKHVIHRAYLMADGETVSVRGAIVDSPLTEIEGLQAGRTIADVERDLIYATLKQLDGDKKAAAASLGISLKTLYNRLNDYEKDRP
ncbi:MAG TPA: helix-turn-helix domain-containing protein, partial [Gammaproteobacteria bacterium]|nr:helix-turn-helix domain-containing protein [Gammaproteobacteria bacterium]